MTTTAAETATATIESLGTDWETARRFFAAMAGPEYAAEWVTTEREGYRLTVPNDFTEVERTVSLRNAAYPGYGIEYRFSVIDRYEAWGEEDNADSRYFWEEEAAFVTLDADGWPDDQIGTEQGNGSYFSYATPEECETDMLTSIRAATNAAGLAEYITWYPLQRTN